MGPSGLMDKHADKQIPMAWDQIHPNPEKSFDWACSEVTRKGVVGWLNELGSDEAQGVVPIRFDQFYF